MSLPKLKHGFAKESQLAAIRAARDELAPLRMWIRTDLRDVAAIRMWAIQKHAQDGLGMLTVDYVQQVQAAELGWQAGNAVARMTHVIGRFKALASELEIPILVLSQLSRTQEHQGRGDPKLSDLRDSGALEQDADKVLFVYVDPKKRKQMDGDNEGATKHKRPVWFRLEKHKDGETGGLRMWMLPPYFNFVEAEGEWEDDSLPGDSKEIDREFAVLPQTMPDPEMDFGEGDEK